MRTRCLDPGCAGRILRGCAGGLAPALVLALAMAARAQTPPAGPPQPPSAGVTRASWRPRTVSLNERVAEIVASVSLERLGGTLQALVGFGNRNTFRETGSPDKGNGGARHWILEGFRRIAEGSGGRLQVSEDSFRTALPEEVAKKLGMKDVDTANVIAVLPGGSPASRGRFLVIGAHYDSRNEERFDLKNPAPGADGSAAGVAVVLELATVLSPYGFDATIVFAAFTGSEQGQWGSAHFSANARRDGLDLEAVLINDGVGNVLGGDGRTDGTRVRCFSPGPIGSPSRELARYVKERGEAYAPWFHTDLVFRADRVNRSGDQLPFQRDGFAAVRLTEECENFERKNTPDDLPEFVHLPYLADVTRVDAAVIASLAMAPPPPRGVSRNWDASHYDTRVVWEVPEGVPDLAGHKILLRETTSPVWEHEIPVGRVSDVRLRGISMDRYEIAVTSLDREGNESLPVPLPAR